MRPLAPHQNSRAVRGQMGDGKPSGASPGRPRRGTSVAVTARPGACAPLRPSCRRFGGRRASMLFPARETQAAAGGGTGSLGDVGEKPQPGTQTRPCPHGVG